MTIVFVDPHEKDANNIHFAQQVGLGTFRVGQGIRCESIVILLCILLGELSLNHFLVQILDQEINHGTDAVVTLVPELLWCLRDRGTDTDSVF